MAHNKYDIGDLVRLRGSFTDVDDNPADPTIVTLEIRSPADTLYTYDSEITKDSTGEYHYDFDTSVADNETESGTWHYRYFGDGLNQAAGENSFILRYSSVLA